MGGEDRRLCIVLVGPVHPYRGGIAHYTACLARALAGRGNDVQVVNYRSLYPRMLFPGKTMYDTSDSPLDFPERRILRPLAPWTWLSAVRAIRNAHADAIVIQWWHIFFAPCLLYVAWACRRAGIRVAVLCHNMTDHENHDVLSRLANALLVRSGASIIVHSATYAGNVTSRPGAPELIVTQHPTYDVFSGSDDIPREEARAKLGMGPGPLCLFFGLVRKYKRLEDLIEAIAKLQGPDAPRLLVAGEFYDPVARYEELIARLGLGGRVTLVDRYIPNEEVALYFRAADVLIAPYRTASQSGVVRIANAFALPVIVSNVGGLPEMVQPGQTGLVVPAESPDALAAAIRRFFSENLATRFAPHLARQQKQYSWEPLCQHVERIARNASF